MLERTKIQILWALVLGAAAADAAVIDVAPGESIQTAIDSALPGDTISVAAGRYDEDIDFAGKAITVVGTGYDTVIQGTGTGAVVTFDDGEGTDSVLDSVFVTGGAGLLGGGIQIIGASPTIVRNTIADNSASSRGSGIYLENSTAEIYNNLLVYNVHTSGDPHVIEILDASPIIINNTIAKGDSNGIIVRGAGSAPLIMNNIISRNGSKVDRERRGRGICDFSGGTAMIQYNYFHKNRRAALLTAATDYRRIRGAQRDFDPPRLLENRDGNPGFRRFKRHFEDATIPDDFMFSRRRSRGRDAGNPDPAYDDLDGSRNDVGFTGGPFAAP